MRNLNWDKELKKVQKRGLYNPKVRVFSIIAIAVLTLGIGLTFSAFSYSSGDVQAFNSQVKKKVKVVITVTNGSGTVNTTTNYQSSGTIEYSVAPNSGYIVDETNTTCSYNANTKKVAITPSTDINCTVVFKQGPKLQDTIIATTTLQTSTPNFAYGAPNGSLSSNVSGRFTTEDDLGTSHYLRGSITNNYVKFAEFVWRVVRINGDGTIRIIYDGTTAHANGENNSDKFIGSSVFSNHTNSTYSKKLSGYTYDNSYDENGYVTKGTDSTIKKYLDDWYNDNIVNKNFDSYVAEGVYCNDTSVAFTYNDGKDEFYGTYNRNYKTSGNAPILICPKTDKKYGGKYKLKVGLLSIDEIAFIGIGYDFSFGSSDYLATTDNYLYDSNFVLTMSTVGASEENANVFISYKGGTKGIFGNEEGFVKPVINLKADIRIMAGNGTKDAPYEVG